MVFPGSGLNGNIFCFSLKYLFFKKNVHKIDVIFLNQILVEKCDNPKIKPGQCRIVRKISP